MVHSIVNSSLDHSNSPAMCPALGLSSPSSQSELPQSKSDHFPLIAANLLIASFNVQRFEDSLQASEWPPQYFLTLSPIILSQFFPGYTMCTIFLGSLPKKSVLLPGTFPHFLQVSAQISPLQRGFPLHSCLKQHQPHSLLSCSTPST